MQTLVRGSQNCANAKFAGTENLMTHLGFVDQASIATGLLLALE